MKRILLIPLLFLLSSCGYGSFYEAEKACQQWVEKGGEYKWLSKSPVSEKMIPKSYARRNMRFCRDESKTNQILGFQQIGIKKKVYNSRFDLPRSKYEMIKRFPY